MDASAVLAMLREEPGAERVRQAVARSAICTVNLAEVVERMARDGNDAATIAATVDPIFSEEIVPDRALAFDAGMLGPPTRQAGLSLGDRFCLALARREGAVALTADRAWAAVADAVGVQVEVVR